MKKPFVFIFVLSVFVFFVGVINAQEGSTQSAQTATPTPAPTEAPFNFEKAYKDYVFNFDVYNKAHSEYLLSKAQYMQAKTLASQTKAQESTAKMLIARDDVLITYLISIRQKLVEAEGVDQTTVNGLTTRLDAEVLWFQNHKSKISSAASLTDLSNDSSLAAKHYPTSESIIFESLSNVPLGKELVLRNSLNDILTSTKNIISKIRSNGDHDVTNAERWTLETNNKLARSLDKEVEAQKLFPDLQSITKQGQQITKQSIFVDVVSRLTESVQYLKEASSYMKEVIKSIKTKQ